MKFDEFVQIVGYYFIFWIHSRHTYSWRLENTTQTRFCYTYCLLHVISEVGLYRDLSSARDSVSLLYIALDTVPRLLERETTYTELILPIYRFLISQIQLTVKSETHCITGGTIRIVMNDSDLKSEVHN